MRPELLVLTGTAHFGFDELVEAADAAAARLGLSGLAQIAGGRYRPRHLAWVRLLPPAELRARLSRRPLVVTHAGVGLVGDAMRAGCRIVAVPRLASRRPGAPNDQTGFLARIAQEQPLHPCFDPRELPDVLERVLADPGPEPVYRLGSDAPRILAAFLRSTLAAERAPRRRWRWPPAGLQRAGNTKA